MLALHMDFLSLDESVNSFNRFFHGLSLTLILALPMYDEYSTRSAQHVGVLLPVCDTRL